MKSADLKAIPYVERAAHAVSLVLASHPGLKVNQAEAHVLAFLHVARRARVGELHAEFGHRRSTLTSVLDRLERRGIITRATDPGDRRSVTVALTGAGATLAHKVFDTLAAFEAEALRKVSLKDITAFRRVLAALSASD